MNSESKILYNDGRRHSWGYNKTNCMYVPVEEEQNQTEAEQRIEKLVLKKGKADIFWEEQPSLREVRS